MIDTWAALADIVRGVVLFVQTTMPLSVILLALAAYAIGRKRFGWP